MKRSLLLFFLLAFASLNCSAQLGFFGGFSNFNPSGWNEQFQDDFNEAPYPLAGYQIGLDYWFRLKKRRIEFSPAISWSRFHNEFASGKLEHEALGLHFHTAVYVLDLASDCNCPTFSKDGNFFSKGVFLEIAPGAILVKNKTSFLPGSGSASREGSELAFGGSIGVGLDLGISDLITVTPIARFHYYPNYNWNYSLHIANAEADLRQLFLGVRLRLHFKEFANARYR